MVVETVSSINAEEAALYDRQIRLWGLDAQNRLRNSSVLLVGISGVAIEVIKNIVLAGIKRLVIVDSQPVTDQDGLWNFLAAGSKEEMRCRAVIERTQKLNPLVKLESVVDQINTLTLEFIGSFDLVCICGNYSLETLFEFSEKCLKVNTKFCYGRVWGTLGLSFQDFGRLFEYSSEDKTIKDAGDEDDDNNSKEPVTKKTKVEIDPDEKRISKKIVKFCSFSTAFVDNVSPTITKRLLKNVPVAYFIIRAIMQFRNTNDHFPNSNSEKDVSNFNDVLQTIVEKSNSSIDQLKLPENYLADCDGQNICSCAIVGGMLAQEVIKALSQTNDPFNNTFVYDAYESTGVVLKLPLV